MNSERSVFEILSEKSLPEIKGGITITGSKLLIWLLGKLAPDHII